jgi:hypothetical protein
MSEIFKPVEVTKSFLGIKKGTILRFDQYSSKYISVVENEEIGDDYDYYSGNAIEIDPFVVERNIGKFFDIYEAPEKPKPVEVPVEEAPIKEDEKLVDAGQGKDEPKQEPTEQTKETVKGGDMVFECGLCHYKTLIAHMNYGLFFPVSKETTLTLKCANCSIETKVFYEIPDETAEESK